MNRAIARRSLFEGKADMRKFLALLTCRVRKQTLEVHAYSLMLTHFHLVVRSLDGQLSESMRLVQNGYVRHFNRTRRRDGPLVRGRYLSVPIRSNVHAVTAIRYVDQNPVEARIVASPADYTFGSARHQRSEVRSRTCLSTALVDAFLDKHTDRGLARAEAYDALFRPRLSPAKRAWVQARLEAPSRATDDLDDLLRSTSGGVRAWAKAKACLADGTKPGLPLVDPVSVMDAVDESVAGGDAWVLRVAGYHAKNGWEVLRVSLLRDLAGETFAAVARRLNRSHAHARKLYNVHAECLRSDSVYAERFAGAVRICLVRVHGSTKW